MRGLVRVAREPACMARSATRTTSPPAPAMTSSSLIPWSPRGTDSGGVSCRLAALTALRSVWLLAASGPRVRGSGSGYVAGRKSGAWCARAPCGCAARGCARAATAPPPRPSPIAQGHSPGGYHPPAPDTGANNGGQGGQLHAPKACYAGVGWVPQAWRGDPFSDRDGVAWSRSTCCVPSGTCSAGPRHRPRTPGTARR